MGAGGRSLYPGMFTKGVRSPLFPPLRTPASPVIDLEERPGARCPSPRGASLDAGRAGRRPGGRFGAPWQERLSEPTLSSTASRLVIAGCEWLEDAPVERPVSGPAHHPGDRVPGTSPDSSQEEARGARSWLLDDPEEMKGNKYFSC